MTVARLLYSLRRDDSFAPIVSISKGSQNLSQCFQTLSSARNRISLLSQKLLGGWPGPTVHDLCFSENIVQIEETNQSTSNPNSIMHDGDKKDDNAILEQIASETRQQLEQSSDEAMCRKAGWFGCTAVDIFSGSFNFAYKLQFDDGVSWLMKIPYRGTPEKWTEDAAEDLENEVMVMRMLESKTTIPVPSIYRYDKTLDNPVEMPFILMEYVDGINLGHYWNSTTITEKERESIRLKSLQDLAAAMVQLSRFQFRGCEELSFDSKGMTVGLADNSSCSVSCKRDSIATKEPTLDSGPCDLDAMMVTRIFMFSRLENHWPRENSAWMHGTTELLCAWIQGLPEADLYQSPNFVLTHPDIDLQNVLVGNDGSLKAIIDWDGVGVSPKCAGYAYPKWLCRDWEADRYKHDPVTGEATWDNCRGADTPEELSRLRTYWIQTIGAALQKANIGDVPSCGVEANELFLRRVRKSVMYLSLDEATHDVYFRESFPEMIYQKCLALRPPTDAAADISGSSWDLECDFIPKEDVCEAENDGKAAKSDLSTEHHDKKINTDQTEDLGPSEQCDRATVQSNDREHGRSTCHDSRPCAATLSVGTENRRDAPRCASCLSSIFWRLSLSVILLLTLLYNLFLGIRRCTQIAVPSEPTQTLQRRVRSHLSWIPYRILSSSHLKTRPVVSTMNTVSSMASRIVLPLACMFFHSLVSWIQYCWNQAASSKMLGRRSSKPEKTNKRHIYSNWVIASGSLLRAAHEPVLSRIRSLLPQFYTYQYVAMSIPRTRQIVHLAGSFSQQLANVIAGAFGYLSSSPAKTTTTQIHQPGKYYKDYRQSPNPSSTPSSHASTSKWQNPSIGLQAKLKIARERQASIDFNSRLSQGPLSNEAILISRSQHPRSGEVNTSGERPETAQNTSTSDLECPNREGTVERVSSTESPKGTRSDTVSNSKRAEDVAEKVKRPAECDLETDEDDREEDDCTDLDRGDWEWMKGKVRTPSDLCNPDTR